MSVTVVQTPTQSKVGTITIKPYIDPNRQNLGLEKYNQTLFDGIFHEEQLACLERNGILRYITGLNEFAPEIKLIKDDEVRNAKIKEIRTTVAQLEKELNANIIDIDDKDFWNKVTLLAPNNHDFWSKISVRCGNEPVALDPNRDPYDLIKIFAIEAGGFSMIAPSFDAARTMAVSPKFYLDKFIDTISTKTEVKKLRNKAIAELDKLFNKNTNRLFYIAKIVDANSVQYKKNTPLDVIYDNMDRYISGEGIERNVKRAAQEFLTIAELDMEVLKLRSIIKDASFYKMIATKGDGFIYHIDTSTQLGRNPTECLEYLKNPLNEKIMIDLMDKVEKHWNN